MLGLGAAGAVARGVESEFDPRDYGVSFDGRTDDTAGWGKLAAAIREHPSPIIRCPPGSSLITDTIDFPDSTTLIGAGARRTVLRVRNGTERPSLYAIRCRSGLVVSDLTFEILNVLGAGSWTAALGYVTRASDLRFENVLFRGGPTRSGQWSGVIAAADVERVVFRHCQFEDLEAAAPVKNNADRSSQRGWRWLDCSGTRCVDGLSINSPGGAWTDGEMLDCDFSFCSQFPFAFAGPRCSGWDVRVSGRDNARELIHIEDGANRLLVEARGSRCNLESGVVGSPEADNGFVQVIGGAFDIELTLDVDLTAAAIGSPNGVVVQAGGPRVSDGSDLAPSNVRIGGVMRLAGPARAVVAYDTRLVFDELTIISPEGGSEAPIFAMSGCRWDGQVILRNPAVVLWVDPRNTAYGSWDVITVETDLQAGFGALGWVSGLKPERVKDLLLAHRIRYRLSKASQTAVRLGPAPIGFPGWLFVESEGLRVAVDVIDGDMVLPAEHASAGTVLVLDAPSFPSRPKTR